MSRGVERYRLMPMLVITAVMMVLISMLMRMHVLLARMRMCAGFRIERRLDRRQLAAQSPHHVLQHVIAADAQLAVGNLDRRVAVAEMPGKPRKFERRARFDFDECLGLGRYENHCAVVEHQPVAVFERDRTIEVEQKASAALAGEDETPAMSLVGIEHDAIDRAARIETSSLLNASGSPHESHPDLPPRPGQGRRRA